MRKYVEDVFYAVVDEDRAYVEGCLETYHAVKDSCSEEAQEAVLKQMSNNIREHFGLPNKVFCIGTGQAKQTCECCGNEKDITIYGISMFDVEADGTVYHIELDDDNQPYIEVPDAETNE